MYSRHIWKYVLLSVLVVALAAGCAPKGLNRSEAIALGDRAMDKGKPKTALATYRHGLERFPGDAKLADREKTALAAVVKGMLEGFRDGEATGSARREFEGMLARSEQNRLAAEAQRKKAEEAMKAAQQAKREAEQAKRKTEGLLAREQERVRKLEKRAGKLIKGSDLE